MCTYISLDTSETNTPNTDEINTLDASKIRGVHGLGIRSKRDFNLGTQNLGRQMMNRIPTQIFWVPEFG